jgi:hypothetical protein
MAIKALNPYGVTSSAALYASFQYAVDHGANIILAGWATQVGTPQSILQGIEYAQAHQVVVVAAAGDRGMDLEDEPSYPASFAKQLNNVVAVANVGPTDQLEMLISHQSNFSKKDVADVAIAAPGENMNVAEPLGGQSKQTSSAYSAALVAGSFARTWASRTAAALPVDSVSLIQDVLGQSDQIAGLATSVSNGARLHIRK